jgi:hypothetical protein
MEGNYYVTMPEILENFLFTLKKKAQFLNEHHIIYEVALGVLMHLFLFICVLYLLFLLYRTYAVG